MPPRASRSRLATPKEPGNGLASLTRDLWQAAVALRGSIEPPDYKRYVLPIIFLRFLSLRFERRRDELRRLISEPQSDYHTTDLKIAERILADPDEYRSAGAFVVPERASWDFLRANARSPEIKKIVDDALELLERTYPEKLRGLLPRIYAGSNMEAEHVAGLINLFSRDVFRQDHGGEDLLGRIYEYFIGEFASSEGKRGGEYFTPGSIVKTLVAMLEPERGVVYDPCCGSGGMFVQSDLFTHHNHQLSFAGQESKEFTYRLCRMNLFIHGLDGNIKLGSSYDNDQHATLKADYILANPPFNDGAKGENGWGAQRIADDDPRLVVDGERMPLAPRNANTMWILHFLHHLRDGGTAGFVMAGGEMSSRESARLAVRRALLEGGYVDCIVQLSGKLFANTQSPAALWFLSKNRRGGTGLRRRHTEVLLIDARHLGALIPGSRKQKQLSEAEICQIVGLYTAFKRTERPHAIPGFCKVVDLDEIRTRNYSLSPGLYLGSRDDDVSDVPFEDAYAPLVESFRIQSQRAQHDSASIEQELAALPDIVSDIPESVVDTPNGPVPDGWSYKSIESVTTLVRRGSAPRYVEFGGIRVLNQKCVRDGRVDLGPSRRHDASPKQMGERLLQDGDILVNSTGVGTLGRVAQVWDLPEPTTVDSHITIVRANRAEILPEVLGAIMLTMQPELELLGEGSSGQTELSRDHVRGLMIAVPPLPMQKLIAPLLAAIMRRIVGHQQEGANLLRLRDTLFQAFVSGDIRQVAPVLQ